MMRRLGHTTLNFMSLRIIIGIHNVVFLSYQLEDDLTSVEVYFVCHILYFVQGDNL
jgi:hypothetical protein